MRTPHIFQTIFSGIASMVAYIANVFNIPAMRPAQSLCPVRVKAQQHDRYCHRRMY